MNRQQLNIGDIVVRRVQYAGCSYHHQFGVVTKRTASGRLRIKVIGTQTGAMTRQHYNNDPNDTAMSCSTPLTPGPANSFTGESELTDAYGYREVRGSMPSICFEPYNPNTVYLSYSDFGD